MKKALLFGILLIGGLFSYTKSEARTLFYQTSNDTAYTTTTGFGLVFTSPYTGILNTVQLYLRRTDTDSNYNCQVVRYPKGVNDGYGTTNVLVQSQTAQSYTFTWPNSPSVTSTSEYYLSFSCTQPDTVEFYGTTDDELGNLTFCGGTSDYGTNCNNALTTMADPYVILTDTSTSTAIYFTSTPTSTVDFDNWSVQISIPTSSQETAVSNYDIGVKYGVQSDWLYVEDFKNGLTTLLDPYGLNCSGYNCQYAINNQILTKGAPLPPGTYYAQATLYNSTVLHNTPLAESSLWQFEVTAGATSTYPGTSVYPGLLTATTATTTGSLDIDCNYDWPVNRICEMMKGLFYPSQSVLEKFTSLKGEISTKPPFGYISAYENAIDDLENATSSAAAVDISQASQVNFLTTIRTALGWLLYLSFGFWVFNRLRHFSLHG